MVMIGGAPVVFKSKYQSMVALSLAEAEYMALSLCTREVQWFHAMLKDLGHEQVGVTWIWIYNQGMIYNQGTIYNQGKIELANNAGYDARTKHVDIHHHFIRKNVTRDITTVNYKSTVDQQADMLNKDLGTKRLKYLP